MRRLLTIGGAALVLCGCGGSNQDSVEKPGGSNQDSVEKPDNAIKPEDVTCSQRAKEQEARDALYGPIIDEVGEQAGIDKNEQDAPFRRDMEESVDSLVDALCDENGADFRPYGRVVEGIAGPASD